MERPDIWGIDGDILLYEVGFASNDDPVEFACHSLRQRVQGARAPCWSSASALREARRLPGLGSCVGKFLGVF